MSRVAVVKFVRDEEQYFLDTDQYRAMVEAALRLLADSDTYAPYLKKLIPHGAVGMKTNCLAAYNPTMKPLVEALSDILTESTEIDDNDIVVWERTNRELKNAGFKLNASSFGRRCLGTDANGVGYDDGQFHTAGKVNSLITRILTRMVDFNVNLGVLKHHSIAGMSAGLKNMYGAINNPNKYHGNNCSPAAARISQLEPILAKQRLTIIDAVRVQYDRGPGFHAGSMAYYNGLIVSVDPVAADRVALEILERMRKENDMPPLAETGRDVRYIQKGDEIGLGVGDLAKIDLQIATVGQDGTVTDGGDF
jgi:uncharacterized protein (DUF362 family)